jgi:hypothetical protein
MQIGYYIPSRGRAGKVHTLAYLPKPILDRVVIVCSWADFEAYKLHYPNTNILKAPKSVDSIGKKRDFILTHATKQGETHLVMLDDDLVFATRREDNPTLFIDAHPNSMTKLFQTVQTQLQQYSHVGVLAREGGNRITDAFRYNMRTMRVLAYNVATLKRLKFKFARADLMCDFDATLTLLRAGYKGVVICGWVQNQSGSNLTGGCSTYRTPERQAEAAQTLKRLHPNFVKVVQKETKTAWGGAIRTDVQVAWKQAYKSSGSM